MSLRSSILGPESIAGLERAKNLTKGEFLEGERCVIQANLSGKDILLGCSNRTEVSAYSAKALFNQIYYCRVNNSLFRSLFWLSVSAWSTKGFLSEWGQLEPEPSANLPTGIPRGLELVWWSAHTSKGDLTPPKGPLWLEKCLSRMDSRRQQFCLDTYAAAVDYVWLHEIAHVHLGHIDRHFNKEVSSSTPGVTRELSAEENRAVEIEADRWAMLRLFGNRHLESLSKNRIDCPEIITAAIGVSLAHILLYSKRLINSDIQEQRISSYPPLWFRTDDILRMEQQAASGAKSTVQSSGNLSSDTWSRHRVRTHCEILNGLLDLANVHPLFGEWLGPVIDELRTKAAQSLTENASNVLRHVSSH